MTKRARWAVAILAVGQTLYAWYELFGQGIAHAYASFPESPAYQVAQWWLWLVMAATAGLIWALITDHQRMRLVAALWGAALATFILLLSNSAQLWIQLAALGATVALVMKRSPPSLRSGTLP